SYGQLAEELSLSKPSVRSLLLRARARLRHRLRDVAAGLGGLPFVRLAAGGDGAPPVSAVSKAAVVGVRALALVGGGDVTQLTHPDGGRRPHQRKETQVRLPRTAGPATVVAPREDRAGRDVGPELEHSRRRGDGSRGSTSSGSRSGERRGDHSTSL